VAEMRKFEVSFEIGFDEIDSGVIELDQKVIDAVTDEWRSMFYKLNTPEEIAAHIAYNMVINNAKLSDLDGWADQPDELAKMIEWPHGLDDYKVTAKEL
jgi:hypothetical protein